MKRMIAAVIAGLVFAAGLAISGMTDPLKVVAFLDLAGAWDPSLAFVMLGAIAVYAPAYAWTIGHRRAPLLSGSFHLPSHRDIDVKLVLGAVLFGLGWGLAGYCPGPAVVSTMSLSLEPVAFTAAMLVGMLVFRAGISRRHSNDQ